VHLGEDVCGECLRDLEEVGFTSSGLDALFLGLGELEDMTVEGVLYQTWDVSHQYTVLDRAKKGRLGKEQGKEVIIRIR
jgi:hypothetical protein